MEEKWQKSTKFHQKGFDLGEKMQNSFKKGVFDGFEKIVLIGSDLPEISEKIINEAFEELDKNELVFGPAEDGGYYLIGMKKEHFFVFKNKPWSQENLLKETLKEVNKRGVSYSLLKELNDIDTFEDLKKSGLKI